MQFVDTREGNIYNASFTAVQLNVATPYDLFNLLSPSGMRVQILEIRLGQASTNTAAIQALGVTMWSGSSSTGPAGTPLTSFNTKRWAGAPSAGSSVTGPTTTIASTTSATMLYADAFEAANGTFRYRPNEEYGVPIVITNNQRFHMRVTSPSTIGVLLHATLTYKELGYGLPA